MRPSPWMILSVILLAGQHTQAQNLMNKIRQKANEAVDRAVDREINKKTGTDQTNSPQSGSQTPDSNRPANTTKGGLVITPPDVKENMSEAESAFRSGNYADARQALKQAMLGVEMEIGNKVLKSLPETVTGLRKRDDADQVTSMGYGWTGLTIHREYGTGNKQLIVNIANNSAWMAAVNVYLSGSYASTGEQNWKQVKVKGYKGVIEYSQAVGYKLSVPIGQSSLIVWEGINFVSEQEMMNAANAFDIDGIRQKLGEK